jgi:hypothetical protein
MWHLIHLIARPIEALLGVFCVVTAIMLYPNEEGKIQSKFEDFWIRVDDFKNLALSRHAAFMTQVARLESRFLDAIFGHKLVSVRSVTVSICCSIVSWYLTSLITQFYVLKQPITGPSSWMLRIFGGCLIAALACVLLNHHHLARRITLTLACLFVAGGLTANMLKHPEDATLLASVLAVSLGLGFVCDVVFIVATRKLIRMAGEMNQSFKVMMVLLLDLCLAVVLVGPLLLVFAQRMRGGFFSGIGLVTLIYRAYWVSQTNLLDVFIALIFVALALILLLHRALWPLLTRTLFRMTDIGTKGRRAILTTVGLALLSASVFGGKFPELLKDLVRTFGG